MGEITSSYLLRVTLRERDDHAQTDWGRDGLPAPDGPTNAQLERTVKDALYERLEYYNDETIHVSSERTDR